MAVNVQTGTFDSAEGSSSSSQTLSYDSGSTGSDRLIVAFVLTKEFSSASTTGVTYDDEDLTEAVQEATTSSGFAGCSIWYRVAPSTGTNDLVASFSESVADHYLAAVILDTVDQTTPLDDIASDQDRHDGSGTISVDLTTNNDGSMIITMTGAQGTFVGDQTPINSATELSDEVVNSASRAFTAFLEQATAGTVGCGSDGSAFSARMTVVAAAFNEASGAGANNGTGTPAAQIPTVSGTSDVIVGGSGTPAAGLPTVSGAGTAPVDGDGSAASELPTASGASAVIVNSDGAAATAIPAVSGTGTAGQASNGDGAVAAQAATVSGTSNVVVDGDGSAASEIPTTTGSSVTGVVGPARILVDETLTTNDGVTHTSVDFDVSGHDGTRPDLLALLIVRASGSGNNRIGDSVTYGAQSLTRLIRRSGSSNQPGITLHRLVAPEPGAKTLSFTFTNAVDISHARFLIIEGAEQADPSDTQASDGPSTNATIDLTFANQDLVMMWAAFDEGASGFAGPVGPRTYYFEDNDENLTAANGGSNMTVADIRMASATTEIRDPRVNLNISNNHAAIAVAINNIVDIDPAPLYAGGLMKLPNVTTTTSAAFTNPEIDGDGSTSAGLPTLAATSAVIVNGDGSTTIPAASAAGASAVIVNSSGAPAAEIPTVTGSGGQLSNGNGATASDLPTLSATSAAVANGSGAAASALPTVAGASSVIVNGTGTVAAGQPTAAGTGEIAAVDGDGAMAAALPGVAGTSTVVVNSSGAASTAIPNVVGSTGQVSNGSGAPASAAPTLTASSTVIVNGDGSLAVVQPSVSGSSSVPAQGDASVSTLAPTASGSSAAIVNGTGAPSSALPTAAGTGTLDNVSNGDGDAAAQIPTAAGTGTSIINGDGAAVTSAPVLSAGSTVIVDSDGSMTVQAPAVTGSGGLAAINGAGAAASDLPAVSGTSAAIVEGSGALSAAAPTLTASSSVIVNSTGAVVTLSPSVLGLASEGLLPSVSINGKFASDVVLSGGSGVAVNAGGSFGTAPPS
ncbi:MAG: beta strand repeat-containing protein [Mycobacterium sp.]